MLYPCDFGRLIEVLLFRECGTSPIYSIDRILRGRGAIPMVFIIWVRIYRCVRFVVSSVMLF